jgi:uncharacterized protein (TIGR02646 family)
MKNVVRASKPLTLRRNAARWKRQLLGEIKSAIASARKPEARFFGRYNKADVKLSLATMYSNCCCYCEAFVAVVTKGHIEHRKPKAASRFPGLTFEWTNLHLGCPNCNGAKGDKWDAANEILDATVDVPISNHLSYQLTEVGVLRHALTHRGVTTIKFADLNRDALRDARSRVLLPALNVIRELNRLGNAPTTFAQRDLLRAKVPGEFGSLIQFAIDEFLKV